MKVALIGFSSCGRSTLYSAAVGGSPKGDVTAAAVPDDRFDKIVEQVKPKKETPATVFLHDDLDSIKGSGKMFSVQFLDKARKAEVFLHVVRAFENPIAPFHDDVNFERDHRAVEMELLLADLQMIESRREKLAKSLNANKPGHPDYLEGVLFDRIGPLLEEGKPLRQMEFDEAEQTIIRNYQFLSAKPLLVAFNVNESVCAATSGPVADFIQTIAAEGTQSFAVCASVEQDIATLDTADQPEFLESLGLTEPASRKLMKALYDALGLITFFTAGENETRAWMLRRGMSAVKAAGTIHSDIERGFIRAEVVSYEDYCAFGSLDAAYSAGKMRLEGKDYIVKDGDLLHIRNKT